jgi:CheY-like chemotaxis protein
MTQKRRVLLVDDDADFVDAVRLTLEARGYQVLAAHGAQEALAVLRGGPVDVALLDLMMEEPDSGVLVAHHLRRQPEMKGVPVILVTAAAEKTGFRVELDTPEAREWLQADTWIDKPVNPAVLVREIERLTDG